MMRLRDLLLRLFSRGAATWRRLVGSPRVIERRAGRALPRVPAGNPRDGEHGALGVDFEGAVLPFGDFRDPEEAARFAALPPIEPATLDEIDWDALVREFHPPE